jgi:hypothetical protein
MFFSLYPGFFCCTEFLILSSFRFCLFRRYGPNLRSRLVRHSILLLSTVYQCETAPLTTLDHMYPRMSEAIKHHQYLDLAIAAGSLSIYGIKGGLPCNEMEVHLKGFLNCLKKALTLTLTAEEWCSLLFLYGCLVHYMGSNWRVALLPEARGLHLVTTMASTLDLRLEICHKFDQYFQKADVWMRGSCLEVLANLKLHELRTYLYLTRLKLDSSPISRAWLCIIDNAVHKQMCIVLSSLAETYHQYGLEPMTHFRNEIQLYIKYDYQNNTPIPFWCREFLLEVYVTCHDYDIFFPFSLLPFGLDSIELNSLLSRCRRRHHFPHGKQTLTDARKTIHRIVDYRCMKDPDDRSFRLPLIRSIISIDDLGSRGT